MNCMKCGRDVDVNQIFCPDCLAEMEKYPVQPGVVIQLPPQSAEEEGKKQARHFRPTLTPDEQLKRLRKKYRNLILALIPTSAMVIFFALLAYEILIHSNGGKLLGQNYSTVETDETSGAGTKAPDDFGFFD